MCFLLAGIGMAAVSLLRVSLGEAGEQRAGFQKGVWVSVFTQKRVHYSAQAARDLVGFCDAAGITDIYLQIFQSGRAYYDTSVFPRDKYAQMLKDAGQDTIDVLLEQAHRKNIRVHAWVNALSIGTNRTASIMQQYGQSVLTVDQHRKNSMRAPEGKEEACHIRENQLFLEPGDPRVQEYVLSMVGEVMKRYPRFDGVHLDYIRYPASVPFTPGSRFNSVGLTYGYGVKNVERFQKQSGLDPAKPLKDNREYLLWDDWKRQQITALVERIARVVKKVSASARVSCAVLPIVDRAYESAFQEWPLWLEKGIVDYVVLMNYTIDHALFEQSVRCAVALQQAGQVQVGIGVFLQKEAPQNINKQFRFVRNSGARGAVFFAYDDVTVESLRTLE